MQTKLINNLYQTTVDVIQCKDGRTLLRFVEPLTWDVTWYENTGEQCSWERMDLETEEYQLLNCDLMEAKGQNVEEDASTPPPKSEESE